MFIFDKKPTYHSPIFIKPPQIKNKNLPWKIKEFEISKSDSFDASIDLVRDGYVILEPKIACSEVKHCANGCGKILKYYDNMVLGIRKWFLFGFWNLIHPSFIIRHRYFYRGY